MYSNLFVYKLKNTLYFGLLRASIKEKKFFVCSIILFKQVVLNEITNIFYFDCHFVIFKKNQISDKSTNNKLLYLTAGL